MTRPPKFISLFQHINLFISSISTKNYEQTVSYLNIALIEQKKLPKNYDRQNLEIFFQALLKKNFVYNFKCNYKKT